MPLNDEQKIECYNKVGLAERAKLQLGKIIDVIGVDSKVYSHKSRVKTVESLIEKIEEKMLTKDYTINDVTDIIGLRFLALYKADLPVVVGYVLNLIENLISIHQKDANLGLVKFVEEAIVYLPNRELDESYNLCVQQFVNRGFIKTSDMIQKNVPGYILVDRKGGNEYSSIHIVIKMKWEDQKIPVEVQVRTVFEDVWAEIDHNSIYKPGGNRASSKLNTKFFRVAKQISSSLKRHLDACADTSDDLRALISATTPPNDLAEPDSLNIEKYREFFHVGKIGAKASILETRLREFYSSDLRFKLSEIDELITYVESLVEDLNKENSLFLYLTKMELALLFWTKQSLKQSPEYDGNSQDKNYLEEAKAIYTSLLGDPISHTDPFLPYRLGLIYRATQDFETSRSYMAEASSRVDKKTSLDWLSFNDILRLYIKEGYSVAEYLVADSKRERFKVNVDLIPEIAKEEIRRNFLNAALVAWEIYNKLDQFVRGDAGREWLRLSPEYRNQKIANTCLDAALNFILIGGSMDELGLSGPNGEDLHNLARAVGSDRIESLPRPTFADTIRNYGVVFNMDEIVKKSSQKVLDLLQQEHILSLYQSVPWYVDSMRRDAERGLRLTL